MSRDTHLGPSVTMATTRKIGILLSLTDLAMTEKRDRLARVGTKGRFSSETMLIDAIGIKAELNLSCHQEVEGFCSLDSCSICSMSLLFKL